MAEVNTGDSGGGQGKHGKKRAKKLSTRIDMTPMVDLAFLLLTFFVMTSTFNKAKTMEINFPAEPKNDEERQKINNALTFILSKDNSVYYYYGEFYAADNKDGKPATQLEKTNFSKDGIRKLLLERNKNTIEEVNELTRQFKDKGSKMADSTYKRMVVSVKGGKEALTVLIKADDQAIYRNVIDLIDELNVCQVGKYAVVDMMPDEFELVKAANTK
ncbi:MAG: biopolymer transporter ExbD [Bacteroidia bacterium]|nr:biopolymer transporter ExbD [Bacteroidia bacterium]